MRVVAFDAEAAKATGCSLRTGTDDHPASASTVTGPPSAGLLADPETAHLDRVFAL
jgi:hypothetical protein